MEKKTMGAFMAALRKAAGLTQQDVADSLHVSNKAVSRWERDECAPDITLIPALAELFGVTCDELLKGERNGAAVPQDRSEPKAEKQVKLLINRSLSDFKTSVWIAVALALIGAIGFFGVAYGCFRPIIGFCVFLLFEIAAAMVSLIAYNKVNEMKNDSELFSEAPEYLRKKAKSTIARFIYMAASVIVTVLIYILPIAFLSDAYSVLTFDSYVSEFLLPLTAVSVSLILFTYKPTVTYLAGKDEKDMGEKKEKKPLSKAGKASLLQILSLVIAAALLVFSPYINYWDESRVATDVLQYSALAFCLCDIAIFIYFAVKQREEWCEYRLSGLRNLFLLIPCLHLCDAHRVGYIFDGNHIYSHWDYRYISAAIIQILVIAVVFRLLSDKKKKA